MVAVDLTLLRKLPCLANQRRTDPSWRQVGRTSNLRYQQFKKVACCATVLSRKRRRDVKFEIWLEIILVDRLGYSNLRPPPPSSKINQLGFPTFNWGEIETFNSNFCFPTRRFSFHIGEIKTFKHEFGAFYLWFWLRLHQIKLGFGLPVVWPCSSPLVSTIRCRRDSSARWAMASGEGGEGPHDMVAAGSSEARLCADDYVWLMIRVWFPLTLSWTCYLCWFPLVFFWI